MIHKTGKSTAIAAVWILIILLSACGRGAPANQDAPANAITGLETGNLAPDLTGLSPEGRTFSLSAYRGQMVLIDFWASWCMPCRMENPNVVNVYNRFREQEFKGGKGFTIFSVSLDYKKELWEEAIKQDGLAWEAHISDLQGWKSASVGLYQITSIPSNVLIDGRGIIIARNLRAETLAKTIEDLLQ